jgi:predicted ATPase
MVRLDREVYRREFRSAFHPIVLKGESGVGKTALAAALCEGQNRVRSLWIPCRDWKLSVLPFERLLRDRFIEARDALVVLDGADEIPREEFFDLFRAVADFKFVRTLLVTSRVDLGVRGEREIVLERLSDSDTESMLRRRLSLGDLDEGSVGKLVQLVHGRPLAATLIANMARAMSPAQLRQVLAGRLYDLNDVTPAEKRELVGVAKPIIISVSEAMVWALKKQPKDVFKLSPR